MGGAELEMSPMSHANPALHNAMWPGLVGKGPDSEPPIDLDTMLDLTAQAEVDGVRFDGVDLFLSLPHTDIDSSDDDLARLAEKVAAKGLRVGSLVAPVWAATGGGSAMGNAEERSRFLTQVKKACRIARKLRELKIRHYGIVRIDSAASAGDWASDPEGNTKRIAETFREACTIADDFENASRPREKFAGPECTAGAATCSCWKWWGVRKHWGFRPIWPTPCCSPWDTTRRKTDCYLPISIGGMARRLAEAYRKMADALRPWTTDFHVAQNDGSVKGSGSHDKTGRHCQPLDPNGKLDIVRDAGAWLRDDGGNPTRAFQHICWDGCMFPNAAMLDSKTWNDVLRVMIAVREAHGW